MKGQIEVRKIGRMNKIEPEGGGRVNAIFTKLSLSCWPFGPLYVVGGLKRVFHVFPMSCVSQISSAEESVPVTHFYIVGIARGTHSHTLTLSLLASSSTLPLYKRASRLFVVAS